MSPLATTVAGHCRYREDHNDYYVCGYMGFLHGIAAAVAVAIAVVGFFYTHIALAMAVVIESFRH